MLKPISTDISDFEALRKAGQTYVDKTAYFHRLITDPNRKFYFVARPRRFGKSLGVTTLKSIFQGHREFFKGLAIDRTDYDWKPHAVIHFNWGMTDVSTPERFEQSLVFAVGDPLREADYAYDEKLLPSKKPAFGATWSQTGRASSLMNIITREGLLKLDYENLEGVSSAQFDVSDLAKLDPVGMLYQTGYLTIRDYDPLGEEYTLGVPDEEVRRDLSTLVAGVS